MLNAFINLMRRPPESKASAAKALISLYRLGQPAWTPRDYASLARAGFEKNVIAYRCVRLVAEAAASAPLVVMEEGAPLSDHPLTRLLAAPNPEQDLAHLSPRPGSRRPTGARIHRGRDRGPRLGPRP